MISQERIKKYNQTVPRYTSYPPATYFSTDFNAENYIDAIKQSNNSNIRNISFYVHIPFCKKICFYCGCNSCGASKPEKIKKYVDAVKKELKIISRYLDKKRLISQIHFGGGTPNYLPVNFLAEIIEAIKLEFYFIENPEIAIECHPALLDFDYIEQLNKLGFNRYSLGIQDFNPKVLNAINREIPKIPIEKLTQFIKEKSQQNTVNFDFIYGLPYQNTQNFVQTIQKAIEIRPDRLVTFSYAHVPWIKTTQKKLEQYTLPTSNEKVELFLKAHDLIIKNQYKFIGIDHYVLEQDEIYKAYQTQSLHRNFQGYCTRRTTGQVYALGVSGISQLDNSYAQNTKDLDKYIEQINNEKLPIEKGYKTNDIEQTRRIIITDLMCNKKLNWQQLSQKLNKSSQEIKKLLRLNEAVLSELKKDEIIDYSDNELKIMPKGNLFIRNVAAAIDPLFKPKKQQYSKSI